MIKKGFINYFYLLIIIVVGIVYFALDNAGAQLNSPSSNRSTEEKDFVTSRKQPDDFVTIKHQPTRYYHTYKPQEYIIMNYASSRNTLGGTHRVDTQKEYDAEGIPKIRKSLEKEGSRANTKKLVLTYNAQGGEVEYIVTFKHSKKFEQFNAIGGKIKGSAMPLKVGLVVDGETYYYDYLGLTTEWQELTIPYELFKDFPMDKVTRIDALKLVVVGKFQENPEGEILFDQLKAYKYNPMDLVRLTGIMEGLRVEDPDQFLHDLYDKREPY